MAFHNIYQSISSIRSPLQQADEDHPLFYSVPDHPDNHFEGAQIRSGGRGRDGGGQGSTPRGGLAGGVGGFFGIGRNDDDEDDGEDEEGERSTMVGTGDSGKILGTRANLRDGEQQQGDEDGSDSQADDDEEEKDLGGRTNMENNGKGKGKEKEKEEDRSLDPFENPPHQSQSAAPALSLIGDSPVTPFKGLDSGVSGSTTKPSSNVPHTEQTTAPLSQSQSQPQSSHSRRKSTTQQQPQQLSEKDLALSQKLDKMKGSLFGSKVGSPTGGDRGSQRKRATVDDSRIEEERGRRRDYDHDSDSRIGIDQSQYQPQIIYPDSRLWETQPGRYPNHSHSPREASAGGSSSNSSGNGNGNVNFHYHSNSKPHSISPPPPSLLLNPQLHLQHLPYRPRPKLEVNNNRMGSNESVMTMMTGGGGFNESVVRPGIRGDDGSGGNKDKDREKRRERTRERGWSKWDGVGGSVISDGSSKRKREREREHGGRGKSKLGQEHSFIIRDGDGMASVRLSPEDEYDLSPPAYLSHPVSTPLDRDQEVGKRGESVAGKGATSQQTYQEQQQQQQRQQQLKQPLLSHHQQPHSTSSKHQHHQLPLHYPRPGGHQPPQFISAQHQSSSYPQNPHTSSSSSPSKGVGVGISGKEGRGKQGPIHLSVEPELESLPPHDAHGGTGSGNGNGIDNTNILSYRDPKWLAFWLGSLMITGIYAIWLIYFGRRPEFESPGLELPPEDNNGDGGGRGGEDGYWWRLGPPSLLPTLPILACITMVSLLITTVTFVYLSFLRSGSSSSSIASFLEGNQQHHQQQREGSSRAAVNVDGSDDERMRNPLSIRVLVRVVMFGAPVMLMVIGMGAWGWSWWEDWNDPGYTISDGKGKRVKGRGGNGLRWFAVGCLFVGVVVGRMGWNRRRRVERTVKVLELSSSILLAHKPLLLLTLLFSFLISILTLPFLSLLSTILLSGDHYHPYSTSSIDNDGAKAGWWSMDRGTVVIGILVWFVWSWTVGVVRGIKRMVTAGVVGEWYFNRHEPTHPSPLALTNASLQRAVSPSLGTICASSFFLTLFSHIGYLSRRLVQLSRTPQTLLFPCSPCWYFPCSIIRLVVGLLLKVLTPVGMVIGGMVEMMSGFGVVYAGLTGEEWWTCCREVRGMVGRNGTVGLGENLVINLILNLLSLSLGLLSGLIGYIFADRILLHPYLWSSSPSYATTPPSPPQELWRAYAILSGVIAGCIPFWMARMVGEVVRDVSDTLFISVNIDLERKSTHCVKAMEAFAEPDREEAGLV